MSTLRKAIFCHQGTKARLVPTLGKDFTKTIILIFKSL